MPRSLVVDDNAAVCTALEILFDLHGIEVESVDSPQAALAPGASRPCSRAANCAAWSAACWAEPPHRRGTEKGRDMSTPGEFYTAQAASCAKSATDTPLPNLREKYLRAQAAWQARRLARVAGDEIVIECRVLLGHRRDPVTR